MPEVQSSGGAASFRSMRLVDVDGASVTPSFDRAPYIDGTYLPPQAAKEFAACCHGRFSIKWPEAAMAQN